MKPTRWLWIAPLMACLWLLPAAARAQADCAPDFVDQVTSGTGDDFIKITCNLTLSPSDVVTKRLILEGSDASGVTVDCNGARIEGAWASTTGKDIVEIKSKKVSSDPPAWDRPENVTVRDCNITGSIRVWGMARNGEGTDLRDSSYLPGHVSRARANAPRNITLDNLTITADKRTPVYFGPGVSYSKVLNSTFLGAADSVALYLDTESTRNVVKNNQFHTHTRNDREVLAIDGSSYNEITKNHFSALEDGGIFLYRNCGEEGTIRHTTPSNNKIINNRFYYNKYSGSNPSVFLGSRNGNRSYCDADSAGTTGSAVDDRDFARHNVVMQNQIRRRSVSEMIKTKYSVNNPNYVGHNETVEEFVSRPTGCWVSSGYETDFIEHGEAIGMFRGSDGAPYCPGYHYTCDDGRLQLAWGSTCSIEVKTLDCKVTGSNAGCHKTVSCGSGRDIVGAKAACNLEWGSITDDDVASVADQRLEVLRASDIWWHGTCYVGGNSLYYGSREITGIHGASSVAIGCKESDSNGGDCHIRGKLYCRGDGSPPMVIMGTLSP